MNKPLSIGYMGTPEFASIILEKLINTSNIEIKFVACQPDKPKGRGGQVSAASTKLLAEKHHIDVIQPIKLTKQEWLEPIQNYNVDCIIVASYGKILPSWLLGLPKYGCLNVHGSILPKYRGASPIHGAILNNEPTTGITIMKMDVGLDTGDILTIRETAVLENEGFLHLHDRLANLGATLLIETLPRWVNGEIEPMAQDHSNATLTTRIDKTDGLINWNQTSRQITAQFRAYELWPNIFTYQTDRRYKLFSAQEASLEQIEKINSYVPRETSILLTCGSIIQTKKELWVKTLDGFISIGEIQAEGKKRLPIEAFLLGSSLTKDPFSHLSSTLQE